MSGRRSFDPRMLRVSALSLVKIFVEEYWHELLAVVLLIVLFTHVISHSPDMLLNALVSVMIWLQLELSHEQWWLEFRRRRPILRLVHVETDEAGELVFHVENIGSVTAPEIYIEPVTISRKVFEKYYGVLLLKGYMFEKIKFVGCGGGSVRSVRLRPYETGFIKIDISGLARCTANKDEELFFLICYDNPYELGVENACTEAVNVEAFGRFALIYSAKLYNEPPPGILVKLPYMVRDAYMYWMMYKANKQQRRHLRDRPN